MLLRNWRMLSLRWLLLACSLWWLLLSWILLLIRLSYWGDLTSWYRLLLSILRRNLLSWWLLLCTWLRLSSLCSLLISDCFFLSCFFLKQLSRFFFSRLLILSSLKFEGFCISCSFILSGLISCCFLLCSLLCSEFPRFLISNCFLFSFFSSSYRPLSSLFLQSLFPFSCLFLFSLGFLSIQLSLDFCCLLSCLSSLSEFNLALLLGSHLFLVLDVEFLLFPVFLKAIKACLKL